VREALASAELFLEEAPGRPRRSVVVAVGRPERAPGGGWSCRVKVTAGRVDAREEGPDSLRALAAALGRVRRELESLCVGGARLYASSRGDDALAPAELLGSTPAG